VNYQPTTAFNLGLRYESAVRLNYATRVTEAAQDSGTPALDAFPVQVLGQMGIVDGSKVREDLPALLGLGLGYRPNQQWGVSFSYTYFLEDRATLTADRFSDAGNSYDAALAVEYRWSPRMLGSLGVMRSRIRLASDNLLPEAPELSATTWAMGLRWALRPQWALSVGALHADYDDARDAAGIRYQKDLIAIALGVEHRI